MRARWNRRRDRRLLHADPPDVDAPCACSSPPTNPDARSSRPATRPRPCCPPGRSTRRARGHRHAQRGLTLTGTAGTWSGIGNTYSYQWQSSPDGTTWTDLAGANDHHLSARGLRRGPLPAPARHRHQRRRHRHRRQRGDAPSSPRPPVNSDAPSITGTAQRAAVLTARAAPGRQQQHLQLPVAARPRYVDIADATPGYTLTVADEGRRSVRLSSLPPTRRRRRLRERPDRLVASHPPVNTARRSHRYPAARFTLSVSQRVWTASAKSTPTNGSSRRTARRGRTCPAPSRRRTCSACPTRASGCAPAGHRRQRRRDRRPRRARRPPVPSAPPVNTVRPAIGGTVQRVRTLTATRHLERVGNVYDLPMAARQRHGLGRIAGAHADLSARRGRVRHRAGSVTAINPDGTAPRPATRRPRGGRRAAGEHHPPDAQRHRAARPALNLDRRHVERNRQRLRATSGSATPARATWTSRARPAPPTRSPSPTRARTCACCVTATNPDGGGSREQRPDRRRGAAAARQHRRARRSPAPPRARPR